MSKHINALIMNSKSSDPYPIKFSLYPPVALKISFVVKIVFEYGAIKSQFFSIFEDNDRTKNLLKDELNSCIERVASMAWVLFLFA